MARTYTYAQLFSVEKQGPVSVGDLVGIMADLEAEWPGVHIKPACKSEGGFEFTAWPGMRYGEYKCIRFANRPGDWPVIDENTRVQWSRDPTRVIFHPQPKTPFARQKKDEGRVHIDLFFKAFHGAPTWSRSEVFAVERVFRDHGLVRKGRMAGAEHFCSVGSLGAPEPPPTAEELERSKRLMDYFRGIGPNPNPFLDAILHPPNKANPAVDPSPK